LRGFIGAFQSVQETTEKCIAPEFVAVANLCAPRHLDESSVGNGRARFLGALRAIVDSSVLAVTTGA
jgi:hypothetical protein